MAKREVTAALDANCITYLIDGLSSYQAAPAGSNAIEETALARCFFYADTFYASPTAERQCLGITDPAKRANHESWLSVHIRPFGHDLNMDETDDRIAALTAVHPDREDCTILVECERYGMDYLLTRDVVFLKRLAPEARGVIVCAPSVYWALLGISRGTSPRLVPEQSNPMFGADWWRW